MTGENDSIYRTVLDILDGAKSDDGMLWEGAILRRFEKTDRDAVHDALQRMERTGVVRKERRYENGGWVTLYRAAY